MLPNFCIKYNQKESKQKKTEFLPFIEILQIYVYTFYTYCVKSFSLFIKYKFLYMCITCCQRIQLCVY